MIAIRRFFMVIITLKCFISYFITIGLCRLERFVSRHPVKNTKTLLKLCKSFGQGCTGWQLMCLHLHCTKSSCNVTVCMTWKNLDRIIHVLKVLSDFQNSGKQISGLLVLLHTDRFKNINKIPIIKN